MNLAPIGKLYRDGLIDAFQARAMLDDLAARTYAWPHPLYELEEAGSPGLRLSARRFQMFHVRWALCDGSHVEARKHPLWPL